MERILNVIGMLEGTNKAAPDGGYLEPYENFLAPFREREFCLLELGVYQGASLRTWRTYFPNAKIVGIDINAACKQYEGERIAIVIGSQDDPELLDKVMNEHKPSIVVDDGSHRAEHIVSSFERIFPGLQPGGYYIVEDAYMHFGPDALRNTGYAKVPLKDYFFNMMANIAGNEIAAEDDHGVGAYLYKNVEFVGVIKRAIVIRKKLTPLAPAEAIEMAERLALESGADHHWAGVATLMMRSGSMLGRTETILRNVIAKQGPKPEFTFILAEVFERQHRLDDAIAILQETLQRDRDWTLLGPSAFMHRMAHYQSLKGDHHAAVSTYRRAIELRPAEAELRHILSLEMEQTGDLNGAIAECNHAVALGAGGKNLSRYRGQLDRLIEKQRASAET
jgi:tetratricopeptide (TPR) repeat protein